jgi:hypothetical protein
MQEGWVCEVTLAQALLQLKGLRTLELGAEINANQVCDERCGECLIWMYTCLKTT